MKYKEFKNIENWGNIKKTQSLIYGLHL